MTIQMKIGDSAAVLDDTIEGTITAISKNEVTLTTADGFVMKYSPKEIVITNQHSELSNVFSGKSLNEVLREKTPPKKRSFTKEKRSKKDDFTLEADLHIEKLTASTKGLSNFDMLTIQLDEAKRKVEFCIKNRIPKLVLIHGVGEGVLRTEIEFLLSRYDTLTFQEASFNKYGLGATEVYFKQSKKS